MKKRHFSRAQQLDNIREALFNMWPTVPPKNVVRRLCVWRVPRTSENRFTPPTCKTLACFGGWCVWWPAFVEQGMRPNYDGSPMLSGMSVWDTAKTFFGDSQLFMPRDHHPADGDLRYSTTDHEVVANRLRWNLERREIKA